jgi:hypothetical protein
LFIEVNILQELQAFLSEDHTSEEFAKYLNKVGIPLKGHTNKKLRKEALDKYIEVKLSSTTGTPLEVPQDWLVSTPYRFYFIFFCRITAENRSRKGKQLRKNKLLLKLMLIWFPS